MVTIITIIVIAIIIAVIIAIVINIIAIVINAIAFIVVTTLVNSRASWGGSGYPLTFTR